MHHKRTTGHSSYSDLAFTFQGHSRSKVTVPKERPYMDYYLIVTRGLLCTIRELQAIQVTIDLHLTLKGHPRSKVMVPNERSYMTSYMLSMITLCLGCMVCEI